MIPRSTSGISFSGIIVPADIPQDDQHTDAQQAEIQQKCGVICLQGRKCAVWLTSPADGRNVSGAGAIS